MNRQCGSNLFAQISFTFSLSLCVLPLIQSLPVHIDFNTDAFPVVYSQYVRRLPLESPDDWYAEEILETFKLHNLVPQVESLSDEMMELLIRCDFQPALSECQQLYEGKGEVNKPEAPTIRPTTTTKTTKASTVKSQPTQSTTSTIRPTTTITSTTSTSEAVTITTTMVPTITIPPTITDSYLPFFPNISEENEFDVKVNAEMGGTTLSDIEEYAQPNYNIAGDLEPLDEEVYAYKEYNQNAADANAENSDSYYY
ncbi:uncharacterized protein LOC128856547 [Anastrepha ludens]|uniref:uncharacterized protein LOC128856547 n=1 Tax=Anastrepha ludens TaxID=28586 RepID=UPI0023B13469|nr:uncharacterized protein LOC128856547 [Anastrepha ludens]